jgi:hypothetical protein
LQQRGERKEQREKSNEEREKSKEKRFLLLTSHFSLLPSHSSASSLETQDSISRRRGFDSLLPCLAIHILVEPHGWGFLSVFPYFKGYRSGVATGNPKG